MNKSLEIETKKIDVFALYCAIRGLWENDDCPDNITLNQLIEIGKYIAEWGNKVESGELINLIQKLNIVG